MIDFMTDLTCSGDKIGSCDLYCDDSGPTSRCRRINFKCQSPNCKVYCPEDDDCGDNVCAHIFCLVQCSARVLSVFVVC